MATKADRLKALEDKQNQIKAQIQALKARDLAQERKSDTRKKIVIGGLVLKMVKDGKIQQAQLDQWIGTLAADRDRILFGLAPLPVNGN